MKNKLIKILISLIMLVALFIIGEYWYGETEKTIWEKHIKKLKVQKKPLPHKREEKKFNPSIENSLHRFFQMGQTQVREFEVVSCQDHMSATHLHIRLILESDLYQLENFFKETLSEFLFDIEKFTVIRAENDKLAIQMFMTVFPVIQSAKWILTKTPRHFTDFPFASLRFLGRLGSKVLVQTPLGDIELVKLGQSMGLEKAYLQKITAKRVYIKLNDKIINICLEKSSCDIG